MIVEQRTYTLHPGKTPEYLRLYESEGMAIQTRILGRMVGYFTTEIGPLNQVIHMWGYDTFEERAKRRADAGGCWLEGLCREGPAIDPDPGDQDPQSDLVLADPVRAPGGAR
jgi:hypothetical protein